MEDEDITLYRTRDYSILPSILNASAKIYFSKKNIIDIKKGKANIQWVNYNLEIMLIYNDKMKYSATDMTPSQARKDKNEFKAMINIVSKAKIIMDDKVKIMRKNNYKKK